jgi:serine/threonine protein kinase
LKKPIPFGKYYLLERINVGGMAEVFKAKAFGVEGFERFLAVKRILPNIAEDEEFIAMFIDEAKIAVQLQHANIAQIFDLGKVEESYFIALEYVRGRDLRGMFDRLRQSKEVMPLAQACFIIMQVCEGLDYAHNKRDPQGRELHLVHRDISPQNVLVGFEGEVKLIDFGIAKAAGKASKTQAGILKGKFGYMSPEQVRGLPIDRRSDIFSVGIVLYELLTGERLFMGESDFSTLEKVRNVEILPPSSYNKTIPHELERIALKALAKDPEDRYQNAIDLHDDLQAFLYTKGDLYSRKDLAAWMKKNFPAEIEEENAKAEQFRLIVAPEDHESAPAIPRRTAPGAGTGSTGAGFSALGTSSAGHALGRGAGAQGGSVARGRADNAANGNSAKGGSPGGELVWDDDELDTQIFEKEAVTEEPELLDTRDLFEDDDDRTVANEPPPDILRAATAPSLFTPEPIPRARSEAKTPASGSRISATPSGRLSGPPTGSPKSLFGVPAPLIPGASGPIRVPGGTVTPTPGSLRNSRLSFPSAPSIPARHPSGTFDASAGPTASAASRARSKYVTWGVVIFLAGGAGLGMYFYSINRPGKIEISSVPADATILVDNIKVAERTPFILEEPPGTYTVSVVRAGYNRNDQTIEVRPGQSANLAIALEAAADTGFELTSEPPGGLVWLDGSPMSGPEGQARTDFRAYRIPPGTHVLEIKGDSRYQPWKQDVAVEAGAIKKVRATLVMIGSSNPTPPPERPRPPAPVAAPVAASTATPSVSPDSNSGLPGAAAKPNRTDALSAAARRRRTVAAEGEAGRVPKPAGEEGDGATAAAGGECAITVGTRPWSELWIDGRNTGRHTPYSESIACGKHKLTFKRADLNLDRTESVTVRPGEKFKQSYALEGETE